MDSWFRQPLGWSQYNKLLFSFASYSAVVQLAINFYGSSECHESMSTGCRRQVHEITNCSYLRLINSLFLFLHTGGSLYFGWVSPPPAWRPHQAYPWSQRISNKWAASTLQPCCAESVVPTKIFQLRQLPPAVCHSGMLARNITSELKSVSWGILWLCHVKHQVRRTGKSKLKAVGILIIHGRGVPTAQPEQIFPAQ